MTSHVRILPVVTVCFSYGLTALALFATLGLHLLAALLAGLLVYELVQALSPPLSRWLPGARVRVLAVTLLGALLVGLLSLLTLAVIGLSRDELGNPGYFWQMQLLPLIDKARLQLPDSLDAMLPDSVDELHDMIMALLKEHAGRLQLAGVGFARGLLHVIIGLVLGAMVALSRARDGQSRGPLATALYERCAQLGGAFHDIVFAQIKISLINTVLTAVLLLGILPLFSVQVPLAKSLVVFTFIVGLLPVVGNLISNTAITIAGLSVSLWIGAVALFFLILIHKLEYFLNAKIVGGQIRACAWELLIAMLVMESAFGLPGLIAAPIYYAYIKRELMATGMV